MNNMKVEKFRANCKEVHFISVNEIMNVDIAEGEGPEFLLADGSVLLFESLPDHYDFVTDSSIFNIIDYSNKEIIWDKFTELEEIRDDVQDVTYRNQNIIEAISYKYNNTTITRLILQKV